MLFLPFEAAMSYFLRPQPAPQSRWFRLVKFPALHLGVMGLVAIALPTVSVPALANDYETCARDLLRVGITPALAAPACAQALQPAELSSCVVGIKEQTAATAPSALATCGRVRRPLDLSTCVVDINRETQTPAITEVLDNCRRSLLPVRFAECVVGLTNQVNLAPAAAMGTCIDARDTRSSF